MNHKNQIVCFGEVLWDLLPTGKIAGGAPMNVAFHLNELGATSIMISRIGADELGIEITDFLKEKGINTDFVQIDTQVKTGIVAVTLSESGQPSYEIVENVAWDNIGIEPKAIEAVQEAQAFVFGSLVARNETSKDTLLELINAAQLTVFDVNLRAPFFSKLVLHELMQKANIVKMNDEELEIISDFQGIDGNEKEKIRQLKNAYNLDLLIVTKGEKGAIVLDENTFYENEGVKVTVNDTIGSGDAFLAAFLYHFLAKKPISECLTIACKMGAYVATKRGGTPKLIYSEMNQIGQKI
jgi:fructokinase